MSLVCLLLLFSLSGGKRLDGPKMLKVCTVLTFECEGKESYMGSWNWSTILNKLAGKLREKNISEISCLAAVTLAGLPWWLRQ